MEAEGIFSLRPSFRLMLWALVRARSTSVAMSSRAAAASICFEPETCIQ